MCIRDRLKAAIVMTLGVHTSRSFVNFNPFLNGMFRSHNISTDKHVTWSLYNSRAFCCLSEVGYGWGTNWPIFITRCNIYISHLCYDVSVRLSVRLSVMEVHLRIIANLGFKFRSKFTMQCARMHCESQCMRAHCGRGACRDGGKRGGVSSRYASHW